MNNISRKVFVRRKVLGLAALLGWGALAGQVQAANCSYTINSEWSTGFTGTITIANNGTTAINGWNVGWQYTNNTITSSWNATFSGSNPYTATNLDWNKTIQPGQSTSFGFQGNKNGAAAEKPVLTGSTCSQANSSPVARIKINQTSGYTGTSTFRVDAAESSDADGDTLTYNWDFGGGYTAASRTSPQSSVVYYGAGNYTITLTVNDGKGGTGSATQQVHVDPDFPSSSSTSRTSTSSSKPSVTSTSSSLATCSTQCNWYGTSYPVCVTTTSGWGYENGKSCISTATCQSQPAPYGVTATQCSSPTTSTSSSVHEYFCGGTIQNTPCTSTSKSSSSSSIIYDYYCNGHLQTTPCSSSSTSTSRSSIASSIDYFCPDGTFSPYGPCSSSSKRSSSSAMPPEPISNPYTAAALYVDPIWSAKASSETGGYPISHYHTAVWLDHIATIAPADGSWGLADHLDAALSERANMVTIVLHDIPSRNCHYTMLAGELTMDSEGATRYKNEFIAPIISILSNPKYQSLRMAVILEPDSLVNLAINMATPGCAAAADVGGYKDLIRYALDQLYPISNVYTYVDASNAGVLGWDTNLSAATALIADVIKGSTHGVNSVRGFATNVAGYVPITEPYLDALSNSALPANQNYQVRQARFYEWNPKFSELTYAQAWRNNMIALGFPSSIGMLIDTSRNGWGGNSRPSAQSVSADLETFVNNSRVDRRLHRSNWCNQPGGIGERPQANPAPGIHAYVWIKAPGESDGVSGIDLSLPVIQTFDNMCDPAYTRAESSGTTGTGAMPNAPDAGKWFSAGFQTLLKNAYPPLQ